MHDIGVAAVDGRVQDLGHRLVRIGLVRIADQQDDLVIGVDLNLGAYIRGKLGGGLGGQDQGSC